MGFIIIIIITLMLSTALCDIISCPSNSPCDASACCTNSSWACVTVAPNHHDPSLDEQAVLFSHGFKGLKHITSLQYRVVFHNNSLSYPCGSWCSNQNKLFGLSRGFVEVMWESCIFSWRKTLLKEPANKIVLYGYGWKNSTYKPWEHPEQNPVMGYLDVGIPYIISLRSFSDHCEYVLSDGHGKTLKNATTPQQPYSNSGPSYFFSLYFGGTETTTTPVTVSYSQQLLCV